MAKKFFDWINVKKCNGGSSAIKFLNAAYEPRILFSEHKGIDQIDKNMFNNTRKWRRSYFISILSSIFFAHRPCLSSIFQRSRTRAFLFSCLSFRNIYISSKTDLPYHRFVTETVPCSYSVFLGIFKYSA